ncbi:protein kinase domain-containing protein [Streptomyces sp. AS58]|uniref:serine/threonine-protein kinase n=1 Tax=Streptomyces sp. AS58 TaxID=1519489 RepID=UPI0006AF65BF|nr:serine/threonine-protein kinase [Streptomyces sp. AS58]
MALHRDDPRSVGGYRLVDRLGSGGMGVVYRGRSRSGREVAVKIVHAQYAEDGVFRARFRQEIDAVRKVSGAFTAPVVDADPEAARPWMATQYVPGPSLADRMRAVGPLKGAELRRLALGLVEALRDIHGVGVVHRDLKPANVLIAEDGPRVIDFGISRAADGQTLTETGHMIGTPPFMSPEQLTDPRSVGPASDVFSLAALLVFALTGRGPFDAESPYLTAYQVINDEPVLDGVGPPPLRSLLLGCLAKEPDARPELDELAQELAAVLPEPASDDSATVTLRRDAVPTEPAARPPIVPDVVDLPSGDTPPRRPRWPRALLVASCTAGAVALSLTAYLLLGPGDRRDAGGGDTRRSAGSSAAARWQEPPEDWRPWRTTLFEPAPLGAAEPLPRDGSESGDMHVCRPAAGAVYCAGDGVLPVRIDGRTGRTVWRMQPRADARSADSYTPMVLAVRENAVLVRESLYDDRDAGERYRLLALDPATGEELWDRPTTTDPMGYSVSGDLLITSDAGNRTLTARSLATGDDRWTVRLPANHYCGFEPPDDGIHVRCAPAKDGADVRYLAIDPADGTVRGAEVSGSTLLLGALDGRLVFAEWDSTELGSGVEDDRYTGIVLIDPATGARERKKPARDWRGDVSLVDGTLFFATSSGEVTAVSPRTGKALWRTQTTLEHPGGPAVDHRSNTLYLVGASGRVTALDRDRGTPLWESMPRAGSVAGLGGGDAEVHVTGGVLIVATPDGTVFTLDPGSPGRKPVEAG